MVAVTAHDSQTSARSINEPAIGAALTRRLLRLLRKMRNERAKFHQASDHIRRFE